MPSYYKQAKEYNKSQKHRLKWVNVYDPWQLPVGGCSTIGVSRITAEESLVATWINVSSLADLVKKLRDIPDAEYLALRLHGVAKARKLQEMERAFYVSVGQGDDNDTTGNKSLQVTTGGKLLGNAAHYLSQLDRVVTVIFMDTTYKGYELQFLNAVANALQGVVSDIKVALPCNDSVYVVRPELNPFIAAWDAEDKAKAQKSSIQEARLETGNLKNHLDALAGKPSAPATGAKSTYDVAIGDTLSSIAQKVYGNPSKWKTIYEANRAVIGSDPNALRVGMRLSV